MDSPEIGYKNNKEIHKKGLVILALSCLLACSIPDHNSIKLQKSQFKLITENEFLHYLEIKTDSTVDRWKLSYPVYQFQIGDINEDGRDDMLVGVIKTTRFDSTNARRLFIFKNYHGLVRPLWLGSRLGQPLVDFICIHTEDGNRIRSIEKEKSGKYLVAEYKWQGFGLEFTRYIKREINLNKAKTFLKN